MAENKNIGWLERFKRECGIRRGLILHGNVGDLLDSKGNESWKTIPSVLQDELRGKNYRHVVYWDRVSGISGIDERTWREIQSAAVEISHPVKSEDEYDMGEMDTSSNKTDSATIGINTVSPRDFLAVVAAQMHKNQSSSIAFIIDSSQYLFGTANSLSEEERAMLLLISKATRDADVSLTYSNAKQPQTLIIFLCQGIAALPPALYVDNPLFVEIAVPLPDRVMRQQTIKSLESFLNINLQPKLLAESREREDFIDALEGLSVRDIHNIARLSSQLSSPLSGESLITLYRYGERISPWEQLNHDKLSSVEQELGSRVKGQEEAINKVSQVLIRAYTGLSGLQHSHKQRTPKGALFFVGPTGVGKTELAKSLAHFLFGDEESCLRFDMSEFNHEHADQRLVGAPPGYVGFEEGGQLTNAVKQRPFSVVLFDEIEKAHPRILDKFLQILEDGRLTDGKGVTVSFSETIIVFTSNIGAADVQPNQDLTKVRTAFIEKVRAHFVNELKRPELLGRIGESNIIPFNFMSSDEFLIQIARTKLQPLRNRLIEKWKVKDLRFEDEEKALIAIVSKVDKNTGGRGVPNALMNHLFDPLAKFLFDEVRTPDTAKGKIIKIIQAGTSCHFDFELD